ncbi:MAG: ribonuclease III [Mucinivorans sp.]
MRGWFNRIFSKDRHHYRFIHRILGVTPTNIELYKLALVHRSASVVLDDGQSINNERLEFLGDAILQAVISELVFVEYPLSNEGALTQLRSKIVSRASLNDLAQRIGLDKEIYCYPTTILQSQDNMYGDAFEALMGALYLDKGYNRSSRVIVRLILSAMDIEQLTNTERDFKSRIIEWSQREHLSIEWLTSRGSEHTERNPSFETILNVEGVARGFGAGRSKKESEQRAAKQLFEQLSIEE